MRKRDRILLLLATVAVLAYLGWFIVDKERILREGELVLFELAPVDPRSLLQGDYLALRYSIGDELALEELPVRGYLVFARDSSGVARLLRVQNEMEPRAAGEGILQFRRRRAGAVERGTIRIGAESYFFEEGTGDRFARARYGGLRIDDRGRAVLVGVWDAAREPIR
ncbi:GDYXXLXY domain-containing protein [Neolewinella litorea]|uniref:GDYXXLXY domain-containing protein n=1 Tax=Neolewinella litorea TaxID=2562452 RepID=A0A4S4NJT8_9BACT|nr:GDYXXLXY domain-containing protein [Neolewinella litorea]THH40062.1 hypothetical protein E4021_10705 [Neolewinella litorea]